MFFYQLSTMKKRLFTKKYHIIIISFFKILMLIGLTWTQSLVLIICKTLTYEVLCSL